MTEKCRARRIGVLTSGGDCPGLNAAIRAVVKSAINTYNMDVVGIRGGWGGLRELDVIDLTEGNVSGILTEGGTILGTSRVRPFTEEEEAAGIGPDKPTQFSRNYHKLGLDCLVTLGGNGTQTAAAIIQNAGMNCVGLPKTIDNDLEGTDVTFGFHSACQIASDAIDRVHTTAQSHHRVMVVEVMGRHAGWLALFAGVSGGGDVILLPEIPYDVEVVADYVMQRKLRGKPLSIIILAEGARAIEGSDWEKQLAEQMQTGRAKYSHAFALANEVERQTDIESRVTVLGYIQRGGTPVQFDRTLATQLGVFATQMVAQGNYGHMVAVQNGQMTAVPLSEVRGRTRTVPTDHYLIEAARQIWTCFGDR